jgi:hypothetical protein
MLRALLSRFLTVRESHEDPNAPEDKFGNPKVRCEQCGKFVVGLRQHRKAMHGSANRRRQPRIGDPDPDDGDNGWCIPPDMGAH